MNDFFPDIPEFIKNYRSPDGRNIVQHWGFFSKREISESNGKLLMLDIDFGRKCSLRCPSCFRKNNEVDDSDFSDLSYDEIMSSIREAKKIGLQQVKICGAGEPLENPLLLKLARDLTALDIGLSIFTKGHVLGNSTKVATLYRDYGINDAYTLCSEFFKLKTSFLVSFQSTNHEIQDQLVGNIAGYSEKRDIALELLAEVGFNKTLPTRLAMCSNPITRSNYSELLDIYIYARRRNILPVIAALMVSGKQIDGMFLQENDVTGEEKKSLFVQIYKYNLKNGINTKEQLTKEGISCMPGIHPCNQIAVGLYLTSNGNVVRCPGDNSKSLGNVRNQSIIEIWEENKNWEYQGKFNCHCPFKKGKTLPQNIYNYVFDRLFDDFGYPNTISARM